MEMAESIERGVCLNCGLIITSEYFAEKKCPCCCNSNIKFIYQTIKEIDKQNKRIKKIGRKEYIYNEYNVEIDETLQNNVNEFYRKLNKEIIYNGCDIEVIDETLQNRADEMHDKFNRKMLEKFEKDIERINRNARKPDDPRKRGLVECPYCKSRDTEKISSLSRAASVGFFGLGSKKIGKQWHCNRCKSDF